jgi:hypothetical protein
VHLVEILLKKIPSHILMSESLLLKDKQNLDDYIQHASTEDVKEEIRYHLAMATLGNVEYKEGILLNSGQHAHIQMIGKVKVVNVAVCW